jgi:hypothetical protein
MTHYLNDSPYSHGLQSLAKLHVELKEADEEWRGATTAARRVNALLDRIAEFWCDLPRNREPVLQAFERTGFLMRVIIEACANNRQMEHSFETRNLVRDTLDELCITITKYREGFNDD